MKFYWLLAEKLGKHLQQVVALNMASFANSMAGSAMIDFKSSSMSLFSLLLQFILTLYRAKEEKGHSVRW